MKKKFCFTHTKGEDVDTTLHHKFISTHLSAILLSVLNQIGLVTSDLRKHSGSEHAQENLVWQVNHQFFRSC
jgi:hypothetical protein